MDKYIFLITPIITVILAQILKCIYETIKYKKINILRLLDGSGGMPSSHSALVSSLTTIVALRLGLDDPLFSASLVFGIIVMYDAMGIRYESGKQAEIINKIVTETKLFDAKKEIRKLKETVGHKPVEVLCGCILGITMGFLLNHLI